VGIPELAIKSMKSGYAERGRAKDGGLVKMSEQMLAGSHFLFM
jgi:hypothetical protein